MKHYKPVNSMEEAQAIVAKLKRNNIPSRDITIIKKAGSNNQPADMSLRTLKNQNVTIEEAPSGTVNTFGAITLGASALVATILWLAFGVPAATVGGVAVIATGATMLITGMGVPKEKYSRLRENLNSNQVLVAVKNHPEAMHIL